MPAATPQILQGTASKVSGAMSPILIRKRYHQRFPKTVRFGTLLKLAFPKGPNPPNDWSAVWKVYGFQDRPYFHPDEAGCGRLTARRIHGHSCSNQARREKARKAVRQATAPVERNTSGSESFGRFDQPGTKGRKEARDVCGCESEDWEGNKIAVGKV